MTCKWIKMPGGKFIRRRPDPLQLLLAENEPHLDMGQPDYDGPVDDPPTDSREGRWEYDTGTFKVRRLAGSPVTVLGVGSVGGYLAYFLAMAQPVLHIVDYKKVQARHTQGGRTIYEERFIGLLKVEAARQKIQRDYPGARVCPYPYNVAEIPDMELKSLFARSLVVAVAMDDPRQILRVGRLAYPVVELVQVALHRGGTSGHIAITAPYATACLQCTLNVTDPSQIHRLDSEPANSWDIAHAAQQAARIIIDLMYSKVTGQEIRRWDTTKNLIYIVNTRQESSPDGPGLHFEASRKRPGCPICSV